MELLVRASFTVAHPTNLLESESTAEGGRGKVKLLDCGAYEEMDVCLMFVLHLSQNPFSFEYLLFQVSSLFWSYRISQSHQLSGTQANCGGIQGMQVRQQPIFCFNTTRQYGSGLVHMRPFLLGKEGTRSMLRCWRTTISLPYVNSSNLPTRFTASLKGKTGCRIVRIITSYLAMIDIFIDQLFLTIPSSRMSS